MQRSEIAVELNKIFSEYLSSQGLDLIDLVCRYEGRDLVLRVITDKPSGGIDLDECARLNSGMGRILEENNLLQQRYILEVSSPGLDRPLINKSDFSRCLNLRARFFLNEPVEDKIEIEGIIKDVKGDCVSLDKGGAIIDIPLIKINRAKQVI